MFETQKVRRHYKFRKEWSQHLKKMQVPNGTGPGVQRSKRPLFASRTRCNVLWKPPKFGNKVKIGKKKKSSSVVSLQIGVMSDHLRVSLYIIMSQNVM